MVTRSITTCDGCGAEKRHGYDFYILKFSAHYPLTFNEKDFCHDCYWKIQGFIKTLKNEAV